MLRPLGVALLLSISMAGSAASDDMAPISLDDIEGAKAARLMKNREDIDVQSTFHEEEIKGTGDVPDELSARLVRNRGPITAKITASGSHNRYCKETNQAKKKDSCAVQFSLTAWKFAGDAGTVHGEYREEYDDGETAAMRVDVDCMAREEDGKAVVGGKVRAGGPKRHPSGADLGRPRRAYIRVVDDPDRGDYVSPVLFDDGVVHPDCSTPGTDRKLEVRYESNAADAVVSVCSKHGNWEQCLEKGKGEQAIQ